MSSEMPGAVDDAAKMSRPFTGVSAEDQGLLS